MIQSIRLGSVFVTSRFRLAAILAFTAALARFGLTCAADGTSTTQKPVVTWVAPADQSTFPAYSTITLKANATAAPGGSIQNVYFIQGSNKIVGSVTTSPYTFNWTSVAPGTYTLKAFAQDSVNGGTMTPAITITVLAAGSPSAPATPPPTPPPASPQNSSPVAPLTITTLALSNATVGVAYSQTLTATGGKPPYTWAMVSGGFPDGLTLNPSTGQITGTPTASGSWVYSYPFRVYISVTDSATATTAFAFPMSVLPPPNSNHTLTVVNGSGSGSYAPNTTVSISAGAPPVGQVFQSWTGATVGNPLSPNTTLLMPAANVTVTATYANAAPLPPNTFALTVVSGTGSGNYSAGGSVNITANPPAAGMVFKNWTGAAVANPSSSATSLVMPASNVTVTANYNNAAPPPPATYALIVVNGTGSGNYSAGTSVNITANAPPPGQAFKNWTGAQVTDSQASATTLLMPAANTTVTANYLTPPPVAFPVDSHPRLWITTNDIARLRTWAVASNPVYQQGMLPLLQKAVTDYNNQFFPGGVANLNYPDPGDTQGYQGKLSEEYAFILAFNSQIDPNPAARMQYAQYARNLIMYVMNQAVLPHSANTPFRDPFYAVYNHANGSFECWGLAVDWIYNATDGMGNSILSQSDKLTIRNVFMQWANDCLHASTTGGDHPGPIGFENSLSLVGGGNGAYRMAANNYYAGHARLLTLMTLAIDPNDDPPINATLPVSALGNSLRSYLPDATGAWLYQQYAMFGDQSSVISDYGMNPGAKVGLASGGLPPEGMLYGHSFAYVLGQLLALQTAGFHDTSLIGPQAKLIDAPIWDRFATGFISSLVPAAQVYPGWVWMGPVFEMDSYGDLLRLWITPDYMEPYALLALLQQRNGKMANYDTARWFVTDAVEGGAAALLSRVSNPWSYGVTESILYFMLLDPSLPTAADPRPNMPLAFYDQQAGRIIDRSAWAPNASQFDFRASWISINHQDADGGQFEFYRKGEWLTKEVSNYDNVGNGQSSMWHNTLTLKNWCIAGTPNLNWFEGPLWQSGSQWQLGMSSGDPTTIASAGGNYTFAYSDLTPLYNRPSFWTPTNACLDIQHASRSILWVKPDYIVVYDRAASLHAGLFKQFNLNFITQPAIGNGAIVETTPNGQHLFVQTLLPANPTMTYLPTSSSLPTVAWLEPSAGRVVIEDISNPTTIRFLNVLQGADAGAPMIASSRLQSVTGTVFDGATVGNNAAVFFINDTSAAFLGTTLQVPANVPQVFVTGLSPGAAYNVTTQTFLGGVQIVITPNGSTATADAGGVVVLNL